MKKVLSLVLVIAMVLSSFSFAFAAPRFEDIEGDYEKAIDALVGLGVVTGYEDGTYRPEKVVTRAEMAKLIVEILGYGDLVAGSKSNFTDTQGHWADSWIALAAGRGLVIGTGDGKFTPDRTVSYDEAITMIVRALGYTDASNELKNMTWPTNFKVKAAELGLTKDVVLAASGADRGGVAQLLYNALLANMVTINTDGDVLYQKHGDAHKVLLHSLAKDDTITVTPNMLDEDSKEYRGDIVDLAQYMYQKIKVYVTNDKDEHVVYVEEVESDIVTGEFRKHADSATINVRNNGKNKAYDLATTTTAVFYNGVEVEGGMTEAQLEDGTTPIVNLHKGQATFVLNNRDDVTAIVVTKYTDVVRVSSEYITGKTTYEGFKLPLDDDDEVDFDKLTVKGAVDSLEDINDDDVIVVFAGGGVKARIVEADKLTIEVVRDTVEGKVTREDKADGVFHIDGVSYSLSAAPGAIVAAELDLGDEGIFYLDQNGQIVDFDGDAAGPTDYAVVIGIEPGSKDTKFGKTDVEDYPQLKLATQDDEVVVYDIHTKLNSSGAAVTAGPKKADGFYFVGDSLTVSGIPANALIKYSLNDAGRINKLEVVATSPLAAVDTTKSTFKLASNAIVFDETLDEDYAVVNVDRLKSEVTGRAVYNKNGEITVLITDDVKAGSVATFAYLTKIVNANDGSDNVQFVTVYMNGEKVERYTDADNTFVTGDINKVWALDLDGEVVVDKTAKTGLPVTATAISARSGMIELGSSIGWKPLAEDATVLKLKANDDVDTIAGLYDIAVGTSVEYYLNDDGEVAFITFK